MGFLSSHENKRYLEKKASNIKKRLIVNELNIKRSWLVFPKTCFVFLDEAGLKKVKLFLTVGQETQFFYDG